MTVVIHHLEFSRGSRIIWLCEEAGIDYEIRHYQRDPMTRRAPEALAAVHPLAKSPAVEIDGQLMLESGAIIEYLIEAHSDGRLGVAAGQPERAKYLEWLHFAEGSLGMSVITTGLASLIGGLSAPLDGFMHGEVAKLLGHIDTELEGKNYLVADRLTGADINLHYLLEWPYAAGGLDAYANVKRYFENLAASDAYRTTVERGGPVLLAG